MDGRRRKLSRTMEAWLVFFFSRKKNKLLSERSDDDENIHNRLHCKFYCSYS